MQLYVFMFDNGQALLVNITEEEIKADFASVVTMKVQRCQRWAEAKFVRGMDMDEEEAPESHWRSQTGAVIDCVTLQNFGPYLEPHAQGGLPPEAVPALKNLLRSSLHDIDCQWDQLTRTEKKCFSDRGQFALLVKWVRS